MKILICGFMGAGKSTFASNLNAPNWEKVELDQQVERRAACTISQIFDKVGESGFRQLELLALTKLLDSDANILISLGGGTLERQVLSLIKERSAILVWINVPFEICFNRVDGDNNRPLLKQGRGKLLKLYQNREKNYRQAQLQLGLQDTITLRNIDDLLQRLSDKS
ncbi:MAG: hypothetical protein KAG61_09840 [Bacteriovoracaceae bacterium]|nr:hypothetical protein [Bacteriovoracaceae bacterium]